MQREKMIKSGKLLEVDFFPCFDNGKKIPVKAPKEKPTKAAQAKYNALQATKKLVRLVNANFGEDDYFLHPTYEPIYAPQSEEQARRDIVNYLRRVKRKCEKECEKLKAELTEVKAIYKAMPVSAYIEQQIRGLKTRIKKLEEPFRYIYVIEKQVYKTGVYAGLMNWHFHLFVSGGLPSRVLESMFWKGLRTNCDNYQPEKFGPEAAARYISKDPQGSKRFCYSRNLKKPKVKVKDGSVSRRKVEIMAKLRVDDAQYWETRYKGYKFLRCYPRYNEYNGYWYLSVVMYRTDGSPPAWNENEWLTEDLD